MLHTHYLDTLETCAEALRSGAAGPLDMLEALRLRFQEREGTIRAFLPEADRHQRLLKEAQVLIDRFPEPTTRPPLFAVPVAIKDIFHVDGFDTAAGSQIPPTQLAGREAPCVTKLRLAGALIVGKAACTELAYFGPGPTRNPCDEAHTPGGSSSGSAAAIAAGLSVLTLGSQTIGSIGRPAAFCGVVGFKPSYDRISRDGVVPLAAGADHIGCFTSTVDGAILAASILIPDWRPREPSSAEPVRRPVLAIPDGPYLDHASAEGLERFHVTCSRLRDAGFKIRSIPVMSDFTTVAERHRQLVAAEAYRHHHNLLQAFGSTFHPKTRELLDTGRNISDADLESARNGRLSLRRHLTVALKDPALNDPGADLWLSPAAPGPAPRGLDSTGDPIMNLPWTHSGLPTLVIPDRTDKNTPGRLPTGLQLSAELGADERLLDWGRTLASTLGDSP